MRRRIRRLHIPVPSASRKQNPDMPHNPGYTCRWPCHIGSANPLPAVRIAGMPAAPAPAPLRSASSNIAGMPDCPPRWRNCFRIRPSMPPPGPWRPSWPASPAACMRPCIAGKSRPGLRRKKTVPGSRSGCMHPASADRMDWKTLPASGSAPAANMPAPGLPCPKACNPGCIDPAWLAFPEKRPSGPRSAAPSCPPPAPPVPAAASSGRTGCCMWPRPMSRKRSTRLPADSSLMPLPSFLRKSHQPRRCCIPPRSTLSAAALRPRPCCRTVMPCMPFLRPP